MKCSKCNAQIVPYGTYDPEAEFIPYESSLKVATVGSRRHERNVYMCSNDAKDSAERPISHL